MLRFDRAEIKSKHLTDEGFLDVRGVATRTGVFKYVNADGTVRRELRHPDDVLKADSLATMKNIPITLLHPKERIVDASNSKKLSVGFTGEDVKHDGRLIDVNLKVTDQKAIDVINDGTQELSLGYSVVQVDESGEYLGERFDVRQTQIKYNHLAIVPAARAGNEAKLTLDAANLRLDADDAVYFVEDKEPNKRNKPKETNMNLVKMTLDNGIQYDAAPEVKVAHDALVVNSTKLDKDLTAKTSEFDKLQAKHDELDEKVKKFEKTDNSEEINTAVKARISLVSAALKHLDEKEADKLEDKTDAEIKELVIKKYSPDVNLDKKSEDYITARFDSALENKPNVKKDGASSIGNQRKVLGTKTTNTDGEKTLTEKRADMIEEMKGRSKPVAKAA